MPTGISMYWSSVVGSYGCCNRARSGCERPGDGTDRARRFFSCHLRQQPQDSARRASIFAGFGFQADAGPPLNHRQRSCGWRLNLSSLWAVSSRPMDTVCGGNSPMGIALLINDLISIDRKYLFEDGMRRGRGKIVSREEYSSIVSVEADANVSGAALWYDALVQDTERATMRLIHDAYGYGACVANYVKAGNLKMENNCVLGVCATDALTGEAFEVRAHTVVNATGPWLDSTFEAVLQGESEESRAWSGASISLSRSASSRIMPIGLEGPDSGFDKDSILRGNKRFYFFVPWRGHTMIGTAYELYDEGSGRSSGGTSGHRRLCQGGKSHLSGGGTNL